MGRRRVYLKAATMLLGALLLVAGCATKPQAPVAPGMKGPVMFVLWLHYSAPWMWGPIPMSPGWASVAVFKDVKTCITALKAAKEYRQMLAEFGLTGSEKGICLGPNQTPYEGPALEDIFDRYEETILYGE